MNILFHTNCQGLGLKMMMERSPDADKFEIRTLVIHEVEMGKPTQSIVEEYLAWADVVFYHAVGGLSPVTTGRLIPLSVFYNRGYFYSHATAEDWKPVLAHARKHGQDSALAFAALDADLGYERRFNADLSKMRNKELAEGVPQQLKMSSLAEQSTLFRQALTMNHPTSMFFHLWANRLLTYLNFSPVEHDRRCLENSNLAGLPCEDYVCGGAVKHLGLRWGGGEEDNEECRIAAEAILAAQ